MRFTITGDIFWESGVDKIIYAISGPARRHFGTKEYGAGLVGIGVVLMCQDPNLGLKQRVRLSTKEKKFYVDVMLDLPQMCAATPDERRQIVFREITAQLGAQLKKRKTLDFDAARFLDDLDRWLIQSAPEK